MSEGIVIEGLTQSILPKTLYLKGIVPNLARLGEFFQDIYSRWPNEQTEYTLDYSSISIEVYPVNFTEDEAFILLVPIVKK